MNPDDITWKYREPEATEAMIAEVEQELGIRYPDDFRRAAPGIHGAGPEQSSFSYQNRFIGRVGTSLGRVLSFSPTSSFYVLRKVRNLDEGLRPDGVIPFGVDGGGDLMAFDFRKDPEHPPVVYIAITEADDEGGDGHVYPLASSFTEFLSMLKEREQ